MPLVLQLVIVMMSKYSKFGVDTLSTFWVMSHIKVYALDLVNTIAQLFLRNRQANKKYRREVLSNISQAYLIITNDLFSFH